MDPSGVFVTTSSSIYHSAFMISTLESVWLNFMGIQVVSTHTHTRAHTHTHIHMHTHTHTCTHTHTHTHKNTYENN